MVRVLAVLLSCVVEIVAQGTMAVEGGVEIRDQGQSRTHSCVAVKLLGVCHVVVANDSSAAR